MSTSASDAIDRDRIREKVQQVRKLDYFQILGMPQAATAYEIDLAYERIHHEFEANRFSEAIRRKMSEELAEIERVIDDARQVLRNEALRDAYARKTACDPLLPRAWRHYFHAHLWLGQPELSVQIVDGLSSLVRQNALDGCT